MLQGSIVALVTPMTQSGEVDFAALENLVDWHLDQGTDAIVVAGSTGEAATLSSMERAEIIRHVSNHVQNQVAVIAGTGTNCTSSSCELTAEAKSFGADAALVVVPYYNKPTQEGLIAHYREVAKQGLPVILYNVPGRTACDLQVDTVKQLAADANIIGIKEASDIKRIKELLNAVPKDFKVVSGDDANAVEAVAAGATGVISVAANIVPKQMKQLMDAALAGQPAQDLDKKLQPLYKALFVESNPIPVKWALADMSKIKQGIRLPLLPLSERFHAQLRLAIQQAGG
jgi:4-hydroxy-tetrahydrodipicolinate synthase